MAITWGAPSGGSNAFEVGIDYTPSASDASGVVDFWVRAQYSVSDDMLLTYSGVFSGSTSFRKEGPAAVKVASLTIRGTRGRTYTVGASLSGVYNGASPSHSRQVTIPAARPSQPPAPSVGSITQTSFVATVSVPNNNGAPITGYRWQWATNSAFTQNVGSTTTTGPSLGPTTGFTPNQNYWLRVQAYNAAGTSNYSSAHAFTTRPYAAAQPINVGTIRASDTQHTISWTRVANASTPVTSTTIQRWDHVSGSYKSIKTLVGTYVTNGPMSWTDTSTVPNRRYRYRIYQSNGAGNSQYGYGPFVSTTPAAPTGVEAVKGDGEIVVSWDNPGPAGLVDGIEIWHASNGIWDGSALAVLAGTPTSWAHAAPSTAVTHTYRLRSRAYQDTPDLVSAYSLPSNVVQLQAPPHAPTNLSPASTTIDADLDRTLTWKYNTADSSRQHKYELRYRLVGDASWTTTGELTSAAPSHVLPGGTLPNGALYEWQVRTWGQSPVAGPWSTSALLTTSSTPLVTVIAPDTLITTSRVTAAWDFFDAEGTTQTQWRARLLSASGDQLELRTGSDAASTTDFTTPVADASTYQVGVSARDSSGLWSAEAFSTFDVAFALPPTPTVDVAWDVGSGSAVLTIDNPPENELQVPVAFNRVWRAINDGDWVLIADGVTPGTVTVTDYLPIVGDGTVNYYRVQAVSDLPSIAEADPVPLAVASVWGSADGPGNEAWCWFNGGPGFAQVARIRTNVNLRTAPSRARRTNQYAGREFPTVTFGRARSRTVQLSGRAAPAPDGGSSPADLEAFGELASIVCFRSPLGHRWFVEMNVSTSYQRTFGDVDISMSRVDFHE